MTPATYQRRLDQRRERYLERKLAGLCVDCGLTPPLEDSNYCDPCHTKRLVQGKRRYRETRIPGTNRRCGGCGRTGHSIRLCPRRGLA